MMVKNLNKERQGMFTCHVRFSAMLGQGWHQPHTELNVECGIMGLCKPGITMSMPEGLWKHMGQCLNIVGRLSHAVWGKDAINAEKI